MEKALTRVRLLIIRAAGPEHLAALKTSVSKNFRGIIEVKFENCHFAKLSDLFDFLSTAPRLQYFILGEAHVDMGNESLDFSGFPSPTMPIISLGLTIERIGPILRWLLLLHYPTSYSSLTLCFLYVTGQDNAVASLFLRSVGAILEDLYLFLISYPPGNYRIFGDSLLTVDAFTGTDFDLS